MRQSLNMGKPWQLRLTCHVIEFFLESFYHKGVFIITNNCKICNWKL